MVGMRLRRGVGGGDAERLSRGCLEAIIAARCLLFQHLRNRVAHGCAHSSYVAVSGCYNMSEKSLVLLSVCECVLLGWLFRDLLAEVGQ